MSLPVLVTGAASGIGRATAVALAAAGRPLVLWDIQAEPLETLASELNVATTIAAFDVTDAAKRQEAYAAARAQQVELLTPRVGEWVDADQAFIGSDWWSAAQ